MEWQADWIWADGSESSPRNQWQCFRQSFTVPTTEWHSASISISADSRYILYVNGHLVSRGPVRSWPWEQAYDTLEIGHLLKADRDNLLAVLVMHYGLSTFSYLRGVAGLIAQLDFGTEDGQCIESVVTNANWKTSPHRGYDRRSPRMACQLGFAERLDARLMAEEWALPGYDDSLWHNTTLVGPIGTAPWLKLVPRDIPLLTEEICYATRVESLHRVKPVAWTATLDVRTQMLPDSLNHANMVEYLGYIATTIRVAHQTRAVLGFVNSGSVFRACSLNAIRYQAEDYTGSLPEQYLAVELKAGDNLLLVDVSGIDHGRGLHIGIDCDLPFELISPLGGSEADNEISAFVSIGPFESAVYTNFHLSATLSATDSNYRQVAEVATPEQLSQFSEWIRPVPLSLVSQDDIFGLSVWNKEVSRQDVPPSLQVLVVPTPTPTIVPVYPEDDTRLVIDFGRELSGYVSFEVTASSGTVLDFYGFEYLRGEWRQDTYDLDNTLRYTCRAGRQSYTSAVRRGFRYLMLTVRQALQPLKIHQIHLIQSNYPVPNGGQFQCSDTLLNEVWQISRHTTRLCMEDTFVDCPAYEQTFWVGDSRNEALISYYLFGAEALVKRCLRLVPGSKIQNPFYVNQVPSGWNSVIPNWTFLWAIGCIEYYQQTGEVAFACEMWPHLQFTLDHYLQKLNQQGLLDLEAWNLLDWAPLDQPNEGVVSHQNMLLVRTLRLAGGFARIARDLAGEIRYNHQAEKLQASINKYLWSDEEQAYRDSIHANGELSTTFSMQTQVIAYLSGVVPAEKIGQLEGYLSQSPAHFVQIGSPFMSFFYYEALAHAGQFEQMISDIRYHYGQMIEYNATTCWEMYPDFTENRANPNFLTRSHCHAWSAAPGYFLGAYILGVRNLAPGWQEVLIEPHPCGLRWARGSVPLPGGGEIKVAWELKPDGYTLDLRVWGPENVKIRIKVPPPYLEVNQAPG